MRASAATNRGGTCPWPKRRRWNRSATRVRNTIGHASTGIDDQPGIVLSDATAAVPARTSKAGRITPGDGLTAAAWDDVAAGAERIARAVRDATGLRTVFHHHCATYVETPAEIDALLHRTDPDLLGLCLDTGHATYGGGNPIEIFSRHGARIRHVHFKDCS